MFSLIHPRTHLAVDSNDGGVGTLRDDRNARALLVLLLPLGKLQGNLLDIVGAKIVRLGKGSGLRLVAKDKVAVARKGRAGGCVKRLVTILEDDL